MFNGTASEPMISDAKAAPTNPSGETPPDVPGATTLEGCNISLGWPLLSSPISVAAVSAAEVEIAPRNRAARAELGEMRFQSAKMEANPPLARMCGQLRAPPFP